MFLVGDLEGTDLLNHDSIDYTTSPYKLKDSFKVHCGSFVDIDTDKRYRFDPSNIDLIPELLDEANGFVFHNGLGYDYLAMKLYWGVDYHISSEVGDRDIWNGRDKDIEDSLVLSKTLNPDRLGNHGIKAWGDRFAYPKMDWRAEAIKLGLIKHTDPKGAEFRVYHPRMLDYCDIDTDIGRQTWEYLKKEWGDWNWEPAYRLEKKVAGIITRQEHRGFYFHKDMAEIAVQDLDSKMLDLSTKVEPLIPAKAPSKKLQGDYTLPKQVHKKDGSLAANFQKWCDKHPEVEVVFDEDKLVEGVNWLGNFWTNDGGFQREPIITEVAATMKDSTHIKEWLVTLGWKPKTYKEKDFAVVSGKKIKKTREQYLKSVETYVKQTLASPFCRDRCEQLKVSPQKLREKILNHDLAKPLKVLTNPVFTEGPEKSICPSLKRMAAQFPYVQEVVNWLTYNHRRNSILGGGVEWEDIEEEAEGGYLSQGRIEVDSRIPTPADTMGAASGRFTHRVCPNIPRPSSLYGREMRGLFGCDPDMLQLGGDFNSAEAVLEGNRVMKYKGGVEYADSLIQKKPNDFHTKFSQELTELLCREVTRETAKGGVKYGLTYGSQAARLSKSTGWPLKQAQQVFTLFWERAKPLQLLKDRLEAYWEKNGKKYILGLDGRKVPTRSKHGLLNNLFQSDGAICAKRQMVIFDEMLEKEGLSVDFFKDDWKNMIWVQQMQYYHDEIQVEMHRSLAKFKVFDTKEEAEAFKVSGKELGNIVHKGDKFVVGYSKVGEILLQSALEMSEYYKLPAPLSMDYVIGKTWADCH